MMLLMVSAFLFGSNALEAQSFQITSATYGNTGLSVVPAGANGATLTLTGTLPTVAQQAASSLLGCFYTGSGSTAGFALSAPNGTNTEPLIVPASTIQSIPLGQFTAANNYSVTAQVYFISGGTCDGTFNSSLTNQYPVQVVAPSLGTYSGPTSIPQTNPSTNLQAAPLSLNIPAGGFFTSANTSGVTTIQFGSFGNVSLTIPPTATSSINVPVPAAFSSSTTGTTASLSICNTLPGVNTPICITPSTPITLTVTALAASAGTITATPTPVLTSGQTVLTAQFAKGANAGNAVNLGAPSGAVNFTAGGNALAPASLILDTTAVFTSQVTTVFTPPTQLAFLVQAVNTPLNTTITPAVQVAVEDAAGAVVTNSTIPVTVGLYSNPNDGVLSGTLTVNAVNGIATFSDLTINALGTGYSIRAYSGNLTAVIGNAFNITPPTITMTVPSELVGINSTLNGSFTLSAPAPAGGLVVTLTSSTPANVTIAPATVTVAAGGTTGAFTYMGIAAGNSTLSGSAPSYQTGTVMTTATAAQVSLGMIPNVAPAQMQSIALSLATAAPAGGTTVTFTIANPNIATVTPSITIPSGDTSNPISNPQVTGVLIGTTTVTATAPGYAPATLPVVVTVTAGFTPQTTNINLTTASTTSLAISAPAPPGGIIFTLSSDSPAIATVPANIIVPAGATSIPIAITGVSAGSTTIRADSAGITEATGTVNVDSQIGTSTFTTGYDMEEGTGVYLPVAPLAPTTVTLTSSDPTVVVISTAYNVAGQQTLTFPDTTSSYVGNIYIQGLKIGTATISVSAPGYNAGSIVVTVDPSGFVFYYYATSFSTTTYASPTSLTIYPAILDPANNDAVSTYSRLNPQSGTVSIPVTSSVTATGTVASPVLFQPLDTSENFNFTPGNTPGTTNIDIGNPPSGFAVPSQNQQEVATVTTPTITVSNVLTGAKLQNSTSVQLQNGPPSAVNVTLTVADPTVAVISTSNTVAGSASLTVNVAAGQTSIGPIWVQGLTAGQTTTLTATAATGYTFGIGTITVDASGFMYYYYQGNLSPTTFSGTSNVSVYTAVLNPTTLAVVDFNYQLSPGVGPVNVSITDSATSVGTISPTNLVFNTTNASEQYAFQPVAAGTTNLTINTPAGFSTPMQNQQPVYQQISATVTAPAITLSNVYSGVNQENNYGISLPIAPPTSRTVTITSSDPATALISMSSTVVGSASITFTADANTTSTTIWIQGKKAGTAMLSVSATGYTTGTSTITIYPSGFAYYYNPPPTTTTTFSNPSQVYVSTVILDPTSSNVIGANLPLSPGIAPATVAVADSAPSVGTITPASLLFSPGDVQHSFTFQPVSAGMTTLSLTVPTGTMAAPTGFTTAANNESASVTVTAPTISIGSSTTGLNLQQELSFNLPQTPPSNGGNGVTVTVTSSSALIATLSTNPTMLGTTNANGTSSVTFTNVTTTSGLTLYVQGQGLGTAQITATAPGYVDGGNTITVQPAGFAFSYDPTFTTTVANGPYTLYVYPFALNTGTLTLESYYNSLLLNPGLGNITVPVTSSNTSVGTVPSGPSFAPGTNSATFTFNPVGTGTSTITLGTPTGFSTPSQYQTGTATVQ